MSSLKEFMKFEANLYRKQRDRLTERPKKGHRYIDARGRRLFDDYYDFRAQRTQNKDHPKLVAAEKAGVLTPALLSYYQGVQPDISIPIAGVPSELPRGQKRKRG